MDIKGTTGLTIKISSIDHSTTARSTGDAFVDDSYPGVSSTHTAADEESLSSSQRSHQ